MLHCAHCRKAEQASAGQTRTAVTLRASLMACAASSMEHASDDEEEGALSINAGIMAVPPRASPGASTAALVTPTRPRLHAGPTDTLGTSTIKKLSFGTPRPTCVDGSAASCQICLQSSHASPPAFQQEREIRGRTFAIRRQSLETGCRIAYITEILQSSMTCPCNSEHPRTRRGRPMASRRKARR